MPNPTTIKPTAVQTIFSSALSLGAGMKAIIPLTEGAGLPMEYCAGAPSAICSRYTSGPIGIATGGPPTWVQNGFNSSYTLKFGYGSRPLLFPGSSWTTTANSRTYFAVFKHNMPVKWTGLLDPVCVVFGGDASSGIALFGGNLGVIRNTASAILPGVQSPTNFGLSTMSLVPGTWYAVAVAVDETTTPRTRNFYVYDYAAQALFVNSGQGGPIEANSWASVSTAPDCYMGTGPLAYSTSNWAMPFLGEIYTAGLHSTKWSAADFATFYADPCASVRGPASLMTAGVLSVPPTAYAQLADSTPSAISISVPRAIGTGTGGTGSPTYNVYRSTTAGFTPAAGNLLAQSPFVPPVMVDATAQINVPYYYKLRALDGSSTADYPIEIPAMCSPFPEVKIGFLGDSITVFPSNSTSNPNAPTIVSRFALGTGRRMTVVNRGHPGSATSGTTPNISWSPTVASTAANETQTLAFTNGTAMGGTFTLTLPGYGTTSAIAWNATAATVSAAVSVIAGVGAVVGTGGPLPTSVNLAFTGTLASTPLPMMTSDGSLLTGTGMLWGSNPVASLTRSIPGLAGTAATNIFNVTKGIFTSEGCSYVSVMLGANDCNSPLSYSPATYQSNLAAIVNNFVSSGFKVILHYPYQRSQAPPLTSAQESYLILLQGYQASIDAIVAANPGTVFRGDTQNFKYSLTDFGDFGDYVHPSGFTIPSLAANWWTAIQSVLSPPTSAGGITKGRALGGV